MKTCLHLVVWILIASMAATSTYAQSTITPINGKAPGDNFGWSSDCMDELSVVGAPSRTQFATANVGAAYFYSGANPATEIEFNNPFGSTPAGNEMFGHSVAAVTSINGAFNSGYAIGSPGVDTVYLYTNPANPSFSSITSSFFGEKYGAAIDVLGDIDGDGIDEIVIGAPGRTSGPNVVGGIDIVELVTGSPLEFYNDYEQGALGTSVSRVGDYDGDSRPDVAAGNPLANNGQGKLVIISSNTGNLLTEVSTNTVGVNYGYSVDAMSDLDGDGFEEVLVGARDSSPSSIGFAEVLSGAALANGQKDVICRVDGEEAGSAFGHAVRFVGDVTSDGLPDFVVGAPKQDTVDGVGTATEQGAIHFYTYARGRCRRLYVIGGFGSVGESNGLSFSGGQSCDFNADGFEDFIAGTQGDVPGTNAGKAVFYYGESVLLPTTANYRFKISNSGTMRVRLNFDHDPIRRCDGRLYTRIEENGVVGPVKSFGVGPLGSDPLEFPIHGLPTLPASQNKPVVHSIFGVRCGSSEYFSNVFARYINCSCDGTGTVGEWERALKRNGRNILSGNSAAAIRYKKRIRCARRKRNRGFSRVNARRACKLPVTSSACLH